jgi:exodeoxyribonuclease-1
MAASFFFYDLETSGFNPRKARIMQFAGQRTDMDLNPIGEPVNVLIKMTPDILPDPDAVLITGITPQQTISDGITEAEFLKFFYEEVVKPDTIFVGFNSIRFDDEFMRFLHYRNFYDPYGWHWKDSCSRWDLLDVARMTRALRPDGIKWPFASDGRPSNRLEYLASVNGLDYLLSARSRKVVGELVLKNEPFIYTTGKYSSEYLHTSVATLLTKHDSQDAALVYDLRFDPRPFMEMEVDKLVEAWRYSKDPAAQRLPVKTLKYNRSPAVAPLGVIKERADQDRLKLSLDTVKEHLAYLRAGQSGFVQKVQQAVEIMDNERSGAATELIDNSLTVDERLYDSFIPNGDATLMSEVRAAQPEQLSQFIEKFKDSRLKTLLPLYKARNYPSNLTSEERAEWDKFCQLKLLSGEKDSLLAKYFIRIQALNSENTTGEKHYLLEELQLYGESIMPIDLTA